MNDLSVVTPLHIVTVKPGRYEKTIKLKKLKRKRGAR